VANTDILPVEFKEKLDEYKNELRAVQKQAKSQTGAIVVNCNPFTLGHRYLVEYAASKVKHLFIFVVETDLSIFPFKDRFELVKQGTADLENVTVLPSGEFIISAITFAEYFQKSSIQDRTIDPSMDVELFAKEIAKILPTYGIDFEVISRREEAGEAISASRVRKLLEAKDFDAIEKLVPKTTLDYLRKLD
jgi:[citrate (pro-3S)-lyase] ligase